MVFQLNNKPKMKAFICNHSYMKGLSTVNVDFKLDIPVLNNVD